MAAVSIQLAKSKVGRQERLVHICLSLSEMKDTLFLKNMNSILTIAL